MCTLHTYSIYRGYIRSIEQWERQQHHAAHWPVSLLRHSFSLFREWKNLAKHVVYSSTSDTHIHLHDYLTYAVQNTLSKHMPIQVKRSPFFSPFYFYVREIVIQSSQHLSISTWHFLVNSRGVIKTPSLIKLVTNGSFSIFIWSFASFLALQLSFSQITIRSPTSYYVGQSMRCIDCKLNNHR